VVLVVAFVDGRHMHRIFRRGPQSGMRVTIVEGGCDCDMAGGNGWLIEDVELVNAGPFQSTTKNAFLALVAFYFLSSVVKIMIYRRDWDE
jgi:hypothetical protein